MSKSDKEHVRVRITTPWFTVVVDGVGRTVALSALASLTFLGAWYLYYAAFSAA
jgi:hypothetical protein